MKMGLIGAGKKELVYRFMISVSQMSTYNYVICMYLICVYTGMLAVLKVFSLKKIENSNNLERFANW